MRPHGTWFSPYFGQAILWFETSPKVDIETDTDAGADTDTGTDAGTDVDLR
jgi:hypothetical protein